MVQKRKKLLKYLRRTDWDSYCLVLSKLGLRDTGDSENLNRGCAYLTGSKGDEKLGHLIEGCWRKFRKHSSSDSQANACHYNTDSRVDPMDRPILIGQGTLMIDVKVILRLTVEAQYKNLVDATWVKALLLDMEVLPTISCDNISIASTVVNPSSSTC
ncbi:putative disease resistance protein RDL6/RF9-like [Hibiscus syriacus]|uniref:Disease resistance protein RDL6/RF9-like n=1 Tax=Hibiscus syriacus TaxID=106335 RepID=A0A6A3AX83_HIBSY|nr:putative disease resistance protein RDL6/RF9-like [Hibiscus syriacus]